ncbi:Phenylalanine--tRNA ligase beta subunit [bioreactor metagenome]|uniref:Phenylalanine--tRNA ligase beta subunit n=1 Tax=bioreactor metagenome TaxID=1076179 RepID=A0A645B692_9ZZZZ
MIIDAAGAKLENVKLFDVYSGKQLGEGKKSVAFSLSLRDSAKTMTDEDADKITARVIRAAEEKLSAEIRK